jgi:aryl-alcohol dehydrogenase-like predicted oxidoreductase
MQYRTVGKTDVKVSEISLGCWTLGGPAWNRGNAIGWAEPDEKEAIEAVRYAIDHGVNHFDNADVYGFGRAERLLAKALEGIGKDVVIATKVGHFQGTAPHAYTPRHIRQQCEQSLENLRRDHIDIYYFHHGDFGLNDYYLEGAVDAMRKLRAEGKIRLIGLSAYSAEDFLRLVPVIEPDVLQTWAHLMDDQFLKSGNPVPKLMEERGLSLVAFSPLNQGLLLDKFNPKKPPKFVPGDNRAGKAKFKAAALRKLHEKLLKVKRRFGKKPDDLARVALQFILAHKTVACPIPGFRNLAQVKMNIAAADKPLAEGDVEWLRELFAEKK